MLNRDARGLSSVCRVLRAPNRPDPISLKEMLISACATICEQEVSAPAPVDHGVKDEVGAKPQCALHDIVAD